MNAFDSRSASVGQLQKYAARAYSTFCIFALTRLQIIQIAVENQYNKKAHGNPLRILNLPFEHSHNSLRVYCASQIFYLHLTTIPCESIAHPKSLSRA